MSCSYNGSMAPLARVVCIPISDDKNDKHNSWDSNQILLNNKDQQLLIVSYTPGAKSAVYHFLV